MNTRELEFVPVGTGNCGRLHVSDIYLGDKVVGQERIYYGKPFSLDERGRLTTRCPRYQYLDWSLAVEWNETPIPSLSPLEVDPESDEDGKGFRVPGWPSLEEFEKHLSHA